MSFLSRFFSPYRQRLLGVSIFKRVLIGNSLLIIFGAIFGTLITHQLVVLGDLKLILLFSFTGILLTLLVNYWIVKSALHPLHMLTAALNQADNKQIVIPDVLREYQDPDTISLVNAISGLLERLEQRTLQLRALSERALNAQEEERVRIAQNLHDDTAQALSSIIIHLERLEGIVPENHQNLIERLSEIRHLASQALEDLRKIIWDLRPSILDDLGLVPAIRWYARTSLEEVRITVEFDIPSSAMRTSPTLETLLFRVTQEAVNNILRHSQAKRVIIRLQQREDQIYLEIEDNGCGFNVEQESREAVSRKQLGLLGIQERVSLIGGKVEIESTPGQGTRILINIPVLTTEGYLHPSIAE